MATIESRIQEAARARGMLTISALTRKAQLNRKTVARLWKGEMPPWVKFSTITKICHALGDARIDEVLVYVGDDDAPLLARAQRDLAALDWRANDLTGYLEVSHERAAGLVQAWHSAGVIAPTGEPGWWHLVPKDE